MWDIRVVSIFLNCTGTTFGVFDRDSIDKLMKNKKKRKTYLFFINKKILLFFFKTALENNFCLFKKILLAFWRELFDIKIAFPLLLISKQLWGGYHKYVFLFFLFF
jgi:hypothetical protein